MMMKSVPDERNDKQPKNFYKYLEFLYYITFKFGQLSTVERRRKHDIPRLVLHCNTGAY